MTTTKNYTQWLGIFSYFLVQDGKGFAELESPEIFENTLQAMKPLYTNIYQLPGLLITKNTLSESLMIFQQIHIWQRRNVCGS